VIARRVAHRSDGPCLCGRMRGAVHVAGAAATLLPASSNACWAHESLLIRDSTTEYV
jgi:hypothetical protein